MNLHFFTAPFYFAFIWFRVQGSGFRALVAASPPFLEDGIFVSQPSPWGILEDIRIVYFVPLVFMPPAPYPARCTRCLPHRGRLGIWERGRTIKKANRKWFAFFACPTSLRQRGRWSLPCEGPKAGGTGAMRSRFLRHTVHQPWPIL